MPPNRFESEVESFLEGSHGDRTHIKRADHHTVTPLCGTLLAPGAAHPRSRGENMQAAMQLTRDNGSSPLTRGKLRVSAPAVAGRRLIPAHAGKTLEWS